MGLVLTAAIALQAIALMAGDRLVTVLACGGLALGAAAARGLGKKRLALALVVILSLPAGLVLVSISPVGGWPWSQLGPLVVLTPVAVLAGGFRKIYGLSAGRLRGLWRWVLIVGLGSSVALVIWFQSNPAHLQSVGGPLSSLSWGSLIVAGIGFSMTNAALEELYFRGALYGRCAGLVPNWAVVALQAASFGALHFANGVPNGWLGLAMTCTYGAVLGVLRRKANGLLAPWAAHVIADACIFTGAVWLIRGL